jgi:hypothetical protein
MKALTQYHYFLGLDLKAGVTSDQFSDATKAAENTLNELLLKIQSARRQVGAPAAALEDAEQAGITVASHCLSLSRDTGGMADFGVAAAQSS